MKKLFILPLLAIALAGIGLTSCLDDNDEPVKIPEETINAILNDFKGTYKGQDILYNTDTAKNATVKIDSLVKLLRVPTKFIAYGIRGDINDKLRGALEQNDSIDIWCDYTVEIVNIKPPYRFFIGPREVKFNLNYDGADHEVVWKFDSRLYVNYGYFNSSTQQIAFRIVPTFVEVDGKTVSYIGTEMTFEGTEQ